MGNDKTHFPLVVMATVFIKETCSNFLRGKKKYFLTEQNIDVKINAHFIPC